MFCLLQRYGKPLDFSKVETCRGLVKTHCKAFRLAIAADYAYFCAEMRVLGKIAYWLAALAVLSAILVSLDYKPGEAILVSLMFCPCALALEYLMPKAQKPMDKVYLSLAVLVAVIILILLLHHSVWTRTTSSGNIFQKEVPPMLVNPAFLGLILMVLSIGDYYWSRWIDKRFKAKDRTVTFFSERKSVTLSFADISYVESNDTEVRIVTTSGDSYRNKTGISQWENLLGDGFLRIHRSYLVNMSYASLSSPDLVTVSGKELPVSRKYKENVKVLVGNKNP